MDASYEYLIRSLAEDILDISGRLHGTEFVTQIREIQGFLTIIKVDEPAIVIPIVWYMDRKI